MMSTVNEQPAVKKCTDADAGSPAAGELARDVADVKRQLVNCAKCPADGERQLRSRAESGMRRQRSMQRHVQRTPDSRRCAQPGECLLHAPDFLRGEVIPSLEPIDVADRHLDDGFEARDGDTDAAEATTERGARVEKAEVQSCGRRDAHRIRGDFRGAMRRHRLVRSHAQDGRKRAGPVNCRT